MTRFLRTPTVVGLIVGVAVGVLTTWLLPAGEVTTAAQERSDAGSMARTWDGKPNLTGLWQAVSTAHRNLEGHGPEPSPFFQLGALGATPMGQAVVEGGEIPYQPWAAEQQQENFRNRWSRDPALRCYLPGIPRAMYMPYPFQIVHGTSEILMSFPFATANRVVHMATERDPVVDTWMGTSNGRWEGDTLVIEVTGFNASAWFDRAGNFHGEQLRLVERITPVGADAVRYQVTFEDPEVFTGPWQISMHLYRLLDEELQVQEFKCVPFAEELIYGYLRRYPTEGAAGGAAQAERPAADPAPTELLGCVTGGNLQPVEQPLVLEPAEPFVLADVVRRDATLRLLADSAQYEITGVELAPWLGMRVKLEGVLLDEASQTGRGLPQFRASRVSSTWGTCPSRPAWTPLPRN